ncbi:MAG: DUF4041 domain-containing protein [Arcobacter sp.]|nr:MAG: DUF4041 domain-containing protein [Arcobacter sp.]
MMEIIIISLFALLLVTFATLFFTIKSSKIKTEKELNNLKIEKETLVSRYKDIIDLDKYKDEVKRENDKLDLNVKNLKKEEESLLKIVTILREGSDLEKELRNLHIQINQLKSEITILDEEKMFQEYGIYKPIFELEDTQAYKDKLKDIIDKQKLMIKDNNAAFCKTDWMVEGSATKGRKMTNNNIKLVMRAFNGECDASISKVKYNNVVAMKDKIEKAFNIINKAMESNHISINKRYLQLKIDELNLTHELREKQYEEKEEQRRIKEQIREEEKAQKELERAKIQAEKEEERYLKALEKARSEIAKSTGEKHAKMLEEIKKLEEKLAEAQTNRERAISRAQMTRSGHVYVISNIGSFGENVYKIGMTRRLEPLDRVRELGDASVPFLFDVHAMIFSKDAPTLENELHKKFNHKRVNMVNERKEFFNVTLDEIKTVVEQNHGYIEFTKLAEAKEYRETQLIKDKNLKIAS